MGVTQKKKLASEMRIVKMIEGDLGAQYCETQQEEWICFVKKKDLRPNSITKPSS